MGTNILDSPTLGRDTCLEGGIGKYPYKRGSHLVLVVENILYADESGHEGSPFCVMAGYIGRPRVWDSFGQSWSSILWNSTGGEPFHAVRFFKRPKGQAAVLSHSPYKDWSRAEVRGFLDKLIYSIRRRDLVPIGCTVDVNAFTVLSEDDKRWLTGGLFHKRRKTWFRQGSPGRPYFVALNFIVGIALKQTPVGTTLHFVFDRQKAAEQRALETFEEIKAYLPAEHARKIGEVRFADSPKTPQLQAADLLAYLWHCVHIHEEQLNEDQHFEQEYAVQRLVRVKTPHISPLTRALR